MSELLILLIEKPMHALLSILGAVSLFTVLGLFDVRQSIAALDTQAAKSTITDQRVYEMHGTLNRIEAHLLNIPKQTSGETK